MYDPRKANHEEGNYSKEGKEAIILMSFSAQKVTGEERIDKECELAQPDDKLPRRRMRSKPADDKGKASIQSARRECPAARPDATLKRARNGEEVDHHNNL